VLHLSGALNQMTLTPDACDSQYNPKYEALWAVEQGPQNPYYVNGITPGMRNTLGGYVQLLFIYDIDFVVRETSVCFCIFCPLASARKRYFVAKLLLAFHNGIPINQGS